MTFFFYGPNMYALRRQLAQMITAYREKTGSDMGLERIDGAATKLQELVGALQATPFLASSRLVIVEGLSENKTLAHRAADLLKSVPSTTMAVFIERDIDQRTVTFKALGKADKVVKFEPLTGPKLLSWAKAEIVKAGGEADAAAIREVVEMCGEDQWRLSEEINKLVNYDRVVTVETVRTLVAPSAEQSIFKLVEAMTSGQVAAATAGYHRLIRQKESEIYVLTMIQWQLRNLLMAKTAPAAMAPSDLAKAAGMSPYVATKMASAQRGVSEAKLTEAFRAAVDCEYAIKTGRTRSEAAVEQLIFRIATAVHA